MDLTFTNYVSDFLASQDFNLHLEGCGSVTLYRKTSGDNWDYYGSRRGEVIDTDIPVSRETQFRVQTTRMPDVAIVTFNE